MIARTPNNHATIPVCKFEGSREVVAGNLYYIVDNSYCTSGTLHCCDAYLQAAHKTNKVLRKMYVQTKCTDPT